MAYHSLRGVRQPFSHRLEGGSENRKCTPDHGGHGRCRQPGEDQPVDSPDDDPVIHTIAASRGSRQARRHVAPDECRDEHGETGPDGRPDGYVFRRIGIMQINGPGAESQTCERQHHLHGQSDGPSSEDSAPLDPGMSYRPLGKRAIDFHANSLVEIALGFPLGEGVIGSLRMPPNIELRQSKDGRSDHVQQLGAIERLFQNGIGWVQETVGGLAGQQHIAGCHDDR